MHTSALSALCTYGGSDAHLLRYRIESGLLTLASVQRTTHHHSSLSGSRIQSSQQAVHTFTLTLAHQGSADTHGRVNTTWVVNSLAITALNLQWQNRMNMV